MFHRLIALHIGLCLAHFGLHAQELRPPGVRPAEGTVHALVGGRVVVKPGSELEHAHVIIRDGHIVAVGVDAVIPADARVHDMKGCTIYAGFIDPHVSFNKSTRADAVDESPPVDTLDLTAGAGSGFLGTSSAAGEPGTATLVTPEKHMSSGLTLSRPAMGLLRNEGFTVVNVVPDAGIFRGFSTLISLSNADPDVAIIKPETFQHIAIDAPKSNDSRPSAYPGSLMGAIAVVRQTFLDAQFQAADHAHFAQHPKDRPRPTFDPGLAALQTKVTFVFQPASILMVDRASRLAAEFGLQAIVLGTGQEWRRPDIIAEANAAFIVPVDFPEAPKMPTDDDWQATPMETLRAWDHAPSNPALIRAQGRAVALTAHGLAKKSSFRPNVRLAIARGLSEVDAVAAVTTVPAKLCGVGDLLGTIEIGKLAHLTIFTKGRAFEENSQVREVWVDGQQFPAPLRDAKKSASKKGKASDKPKPKLREALTASPALKDRGPLLSPKSVFIRGATVWTCGPQGNLKDAGVLITSGKISAVGDVKDVPADADIIEVPGAHVTPGIIDCHSHSMIMGGVNEGTLPSTAMVRVADVVNSESETIHQQLAGGLTTTNLLHGSANPIGGQNCVIKLRDGASPEGLKLQGAPGGIKFALGENVKQSNWGDAFKNRFPQSRMGVPVFHTNRFTAAQQYTVALEKAKTGGPPVRRNLELEAIAEIIRGERLIHCHSYRQDEILAFLRVMEGFKVRVATLQHILEGYKVADEIAKHGAGASSFSDWWAYKYEVLDAIPYSGSIMHERGIVVSFNSDSSDHARRLNLEAAKAVKYGNTSEVEALKFVTLNPAKQLGIDKQVGSLEVGKDGDFVVWSGHPLATNSICLQTWIDGKQYFEREAANTRAKARHTEHLALIDKAKKLAAEPSTDAAKKAVEKKFFFRALEDRSGHICIDCCMDRELEWKN